MHEKHTSRRPVRENLWLRTGLLTGLRPWRSFLALVLLSLPFAASAAGRADTVYLVSNLHTKAEAGSIPKAKQSYSWVWGIDKDTAILTCRTISKEADTAARCRVIRTYQRDGSDFFVSRVRINGPVTVDDEGSIWFVKKYKASFPVVPEGIDMKSLSDIWETANPAVNKDRDNGMPECVASAKSSGKSLFNNEKPCASGTAFIEALAEKTADIQRWLVNEFNENLKGEKEGLRMKAEGERMKAEGERMKAEGERMKADALRRKADALRRKAEADRQMRESEKAMRRIEAEDAAASANSCAPDGNGIEGPFKYNFDTRCGYRVKRCVGGGTCYYTKF